MRGLVALLALFALLLAKEPISEYRPVRGVFLDGKTQMVALRSFTKEGKSYYLAVNPQTLQTKVIKAFGVKLESLDEKSFDTPYTKALMRYTSPPYPLQNDGLTHAETNLFDALFLTVDLCPSQKEGFEREFFEAAMQMPHWGSAFGVAVCLTGAWLKNHEEEFKRLLTWQEEGKVAITWVNHTLNHRHNYPLKPLNEDFMLAPKTDALFEILELEKLLLANGQVPSVFFRFPGLVSDEKLVLLLRDLGLIPLGADAWLAKGEKPHPGSIVLVHGNKNEPRGIEEAMKLFEKIQKNGWRFYPLSMAIVQHADPNSF